MLRVSNHTACRFAEKTRFFRSLWAGRRCAAASRFTFFKVETRYSTTRLLISVAPDRDANASTASARQASRASRDEKP